MNSFRLARHRTNDLQDELRRAGGLRRPARIAVDDPTDAAAISPALAGIGVECVTRASLPFIDELMALIAKKSTGDDPIPGLLQVKGFSVPAMTHLFEIAAEYHRLAPWRYFGDKTPIAITTGAGADTRYTIVKGKRRKDGTDLWPVDREIEVEVVGGRETVHIRGEVDLVPESA